jgi:hypothetical protein
MPRYIGRSVDIARMGKVQGQITQGVGSGLLILIKRLYQLRRVPKGTLIALTAKVVSRNFLTNLKFSAGQNGQSLNNSKTEARYLCPMQRAWLFSQDTWNSFL